MPPSWMSAQTSVTTGQPLTAWVPARGARLVKFLLYDEDATNAASLILEACEELDVNGNAVHSELLEPNVDISCSPGTQRTYLITDCPHGFVRLSASGPSPGFASTLVRGGVEVIR